MLSHSPEQGDGTVAAARGKARKGQRSDFERLAYSVDEAAAVLGIARETVYELIRTGQLRSRKAGSRRIIGRHHLLDFWTATLLRRRIIVERRSPVAGSWLQCRLPQC
jgi:excisionase family DNA binding protein